MRARIHILAGLMIAGAGLACDPASDTDPRVAECLALTGLECNDDTGDTDTDGPAETCGYRTETQSTWGAACEGDAPACLRDEHYLELFPEGLYVGCGEYTANLLQPAAVELALATTGDPRALLKSEAVAYDGVGDPVVGTALFGEVVALRLNVAFDALPGFTSGDPATPLADLQVADAGSPCLGMTVQQVLGEADLVLGGCLAALTPAEAHACVTAINASFVPEPATCDDAPKKHKLKKKPKKKEAECADPAPVCSALLAAP